MIPETPPLPIETTPVTQECVFKTAEKYQLPPRLLFAVLKVEGGQVGQMRANSNGTYDIGPMQINTWWIQKFAPYVSPTKILYNGCVNVQVGAWILKNSILEAGGDFWKGVGYYHSHSPKHHREYQKRVYFAARSLG